MNDLKSFSLNSKEDIEEMKNIKLINELYIR